MRFWLNLPLRNQAGDGDGSGGGNSGSGAPAGGALTLEAIEALFDKKLNGYDKNLQKKLSKIGQPAAGAGTSGDGDGSDDGDGDGNGNVSAKTKSGDPEVARIRKQQEKLQKELADERAANQRERESVKAEKKDAAIRRELAKISFLDDEAFETAYARLERDVKFTEDGQLVGGEDELPLGKFVGERMKKLDFLVKPRDVGGAGTANGGKQQPAGDVDIDNIKPGMKPDEKARIYAAIQALKPK